MKKFEKKSLLELRKMPLEEVEEYYRNLREYKINSSAKIKGLKIRKIIHPLLLGGIKLERIFDKGKLNIINDESIKTDKPVLYACTHFGRNDPEIAFESIKKHSHLFMGDPKSAYRNFTGLLVFLNGVIFVDTWHKKDREVAEKTANKLLKQKERILIYPEGAWNITENKAVMKLFKGTVKMAIASKTEVIPMAIERYDKNYYVNIGKNINYENCNIEDARSLSDDLRDTLATLKWDIWEQYGHDVRRNIDDDYKAKYLKEFTDQMDDDYNLDDINRSKYLEKKETTPEEVYSFMKRLKPCKENAFLFRK